MSSGYSPLWKRTLIKTLPFLFKKCRAGNYHWFWDRLCFCGRHECCGSWHGGIYDIKTGKEYPPCECCDPYNIRTQYINRLEQNSEFLREETGRNCSYFGRI